MTLKELNEKASEFSLSPEVIEQRERDRISFIEKFPIDQIANLTLDEFAVGKGNKESFCYWLEFEDILFGIGGGNATKFGLYRSKDGNFYRGVQSNKKHLIGSELDEFFDKIKNGILSALEYTRNDQTEKIPTLELPFWPMVTQKIVALYYPNKFLMTGSRKVLVKLAQALKFDHISLERENLVQINYECKKYLSSLPEYEGWPYGKLGKYVWLAFGNEIMMDYYLMGSKYAGTQDQLDKMLEKEVVSTGFEWSLDLKDYYLKPQSEIVAHLKKYGQNPKSQEALKHFLSLKVGDRIAIKGSGMPKAGKPFLSIKAVAEVVERDGEVYRHEPDGLGHLINVEFIETELEREYELGGYGRTIHKLNKKDHINMIFKNEYSQVVSKSNTMKFPLNTIFYGPPGTGKTYHTVMRAAEIIEQRKFDKHENALKVFNENLHNRIEFITFHQNYSYEDFVQGLRPLTDDASSLVFEKKDGVFKRISDRALENIIAANAPHEQLVKESLFEEAIDLFSEELDEEEENYAINKTAYIFDVEKDAFRYTGDNWGNATGLRMKFSDLLEFHRNGVQSRKDVKKLQDISGLANQHATYYYLVYKKILEYLPERSESIERVERQNYVLIIDEINRANVSRVFGELITLIEPDKRFGNELALQIQLPSGDKFTVPANLYIIGTMNTADKSIALLDIALRRRFEFKSFYPMYDLDGLDKNDASLLQKINREIIDTKGHDFQIGHAYFMGEGESLKDRMNNKVIPLLLEYYMNDEKAVKAILSAAGLRVDANAWPLKIIAE